MNLAMSKADREAFLSETRVGVLSIPEAGLGPLAVPVWYMYQPGGSVRLVTGGSSRKAQLLRKAGRASLCVQVDAPPYKYVSVEGPVEIVGPPDFERDVGPTARRYLGAEGAEIVALRKGASRRCPRELDTRAVAECGLPQVAGRTDRGVDQYNAG